MDRRCTTYAQAIVVLTIFVSGCASDSQTERVAWRLAMPVAPSPMIETPAPAPAFAPVPSPAPAPAPAPALGKPPLNSAKFKPVLYKLWYATNRMPIMAKGEVVDYSRQRNKHGVQYGNLYAEIPKDHLTVTANPSWLSRLFPTSEARLGLTKPNELDAQAYIHRLKTELSDVDPKERQVLIYLHGFNTTFKEAAQRAASIGYHVKIHSTAFFSWPSQGGMSKYWADKDLADLSTDNIADFIIKTHAESGAARVHLIAHSMGNYALLGAMYRPKMQQAIKDGLRFGQVILAAPDVETGRFERDVGLLATIAERVSIYVSDGDRALTLSRNVASGLARAGLRPPVVVIENIDTVDVSSTNLTVLGHAYISQEISVLNDMHHLIRYNTAPSERFRLLKKANYWELQ